MILRPHHLLCTLGYQGLGYSKNFVENMNYIVNELNQNNNLIISLKIYTDDICKYCPKMLEENNCIENDSVLLYDKKVLEEFSLEQKNYLYKDLLKILKEKSNEKKLNYICGDCSWFNDCLVRKNLLI